MTAPPQGLVLADLPERNQLRHLQSTLEKQRDRIAALDLEIETLRSQLTDFAAYYADRLRAEQQALQRIDAWVQHLQRWTDLLEQHGRQPLPEDKFVELGGRVAARRGKELKRQARQPKPSAPAPEPKVLAADLAERLKNAYRRLARRYHPDLASNEAERLRFSGLMARINSLYHAGDLERLLALREQERGGELEDVEVPIEAQIQQLSQRRDWFETVVKNLDEERSALEQSPICELWRNVEQARLNQRDLVGELQHQLQERVQHAYDDVTAAAHCLEDAVSRHNRTLTQKNPEALSTPFDPHAHDEWIQRGLRELSQQHFSAAAHARAKDIEALASNNPAMLRLLLLTHVATLSPLPLGGLERYDDLLLRFNTLSADDAAPARLEELLVQSDQWVEYGVRHATPNLAHVALHFRHDDIRSAVILSLETLPVRRVFKQVLSVLGDYAECEGCGHHVFAVPLYRTRGLDDLRASVCPRCGTTLRSYWMPRGKDVQAVLNSTFIAYEIVSEFTFHLGRAAIAMQVVPQQLQTLSVGELKERLVRDVFTRHAIEVAADQVHLYQHNKRSPEKVPLDQVDPPSFIIHLQPDAGISEADALELIRHRVRNRFRS